MDEVGEAVLDAARTVLPGADLHLDAVLHDGERASVARLHDGQRSLVAKRFHGAGEEWVREAAALAVLAGTDAPAVVAEGADPQVLVLTDLGTGPTVADHLLGDDPATAGASLLDWATALARLHAATADRREDFRAALAARAGELPVDDALADPDLDAAARTLDHRLGALGLRIPGDALDELRGLGTRLGADAGAALTPADTCPDNNVHTDGRLVLLDYEGAHWRHVAWDVAYLLVPWPTCWCSWSVPADAAAGAVARYREVAAPSLPFVAEDAFGRDVEAALVGWVFASLAYSLDRVLGDALEEDDGGGGSDGVELDRPIAGDRPSPSRRALVVHRLARASATTELPDLAELAAVLLDALRTRWGDVRLEPAPAFRAVAG